MRKNIVVMPCLHRPEFLALALEKLGEAKADDIAEVQIYLDVCSDKTLDEVEYVRDMYYPAAALLQAQSHPEAVSGCWNILNSLKAGYDSGAEYVFLVEEDVMVQKNFFDWHLDTWEEDHHGCLFASCGRLIERYGRGHYTNPGSCFHRRSLQKIVPHINADFFADRRGYLDKHFGAMDEASDLDDGLIRRVNRQCGGVLAWPDKPVAFHQGFHAYNLFIEYKNDGPIQERISRLRSIIKTIDPNGRYTKDFEPFQEAQ